MFSRIQNDVFDSNSNPSLTSSKLAARPVVRRSASDSIGARLRKISFEIGNGRRHSDDLSPDELKNMPQVCFKTGIPVPQTKLNFWLSLSAKQLQNPCSAFLCTMFGLFKKLIVSPPIRLKGNSKHTSGNFVGSVRYP